MKSYIHPEVLVTTDWVKEHLSDPGVKLVEIDVDTKAYDAGHIPGAVGFNWQTQLQDQVSRTTLPFLATAPILAIPATSGQTW